MITTFAWWLGIVAIQRALPGGQLVNVETASWIPVAADCRLGFTGAHTGLRAVRCGAVVSEDRHVRRRRPGESEQHDTHDHCQPDGADAAGVATITLNRPDKRNAMSFQLVEELLAALNEIERSSSQVVILTGAGKAFCAGLDLDDLKSVLGKTHEENVKDSARMARIFRRLYEFPRPTIAAVNGAAIAGGTGLATMCDFTLAVPEAKFGYTEVRIGFVPAIVSSILVWQVGHKIARDLLLTGRLFDAAEAYRFGLVNEIVPPEKLTHRAQELAAQILENSPSSVRATKKLINGFISAQLDTQIAAAIEDNARIRTTADFREGITAFLEKRKPRWSSK